MLCLLVQIGVIQSEQRPAQLASSMIQLARAKQQAANARAAVAAQQERIQHDKAAVNKALAEAAKVRLGHVIQTCSC